MDEPIPSFPAIIRNPELADRYAHPKSPVTFSNKREEREGRRWIKRKDNARFTGNPHIVLATKKDYTVPLPNIRPTFPEPLPPYLPRNSRLPSVITPTQDPISSNAGRFSLSLKGMRRELRKSGLRAQYLVLDIEDEMVKWLQEGGTVLAPDAVDRNALHFPGVPLKNIEFIQEVSRTPLQLVWSIAHDSFARYVVHCCARYHEIISFSKEVSGVRLTYLLRPNVTRPDFCATAVLDSPPVTDLDYSSQIDTESDLVSDRETRSDAGESDSGVLGPLPTVSETPTSYSYSPPLLDPMYEEVWSVIRDGDVEDGELRDEVELVGQMGSLTVHEVPKPILQPTLNSAPRAKPRTVMRTRVWDSRQGRSASSPSRSPARRLPRRVRVRVDPSLVHKATSTSFYDYLFA